MIAFEAVIGPGISGPRGLAGARVLMISRATINGGHAGKDRHQNCELPRAHLFFFPTGGWIRIRGASTRLEADLGHTRGGHADHFPVRRQRCDLERRRRQPV